MWSPNFATAFEPACDKMGARPAPSVLKFAEQSVLNVLCVSSGSPLLFSGPGLWRGSVSQDLCWA